MKEDLRSVAERIGHPPTSVEYQEFGEFSVTTAQNVTGSWNNALKAAGFEPHAENNISKALLLQEINKLETELGKVPTATDMDEHGRFSKRCYFDRWDGWQAAVREAGYEPVGRPTGRDNYNWKEYSAHEYRGYGPNWKDQRAKALERDNYTCQTPGCKCSMEEHREEFNHGLHVHHIRPLCTFEDEGDVNFEQANRIENLVTVCAKHHHLWERASPLRLDTCRQHRD